MGKILEDGTKTKSLVEYLFTMSTNHYFSVFTQISQYLHMKGEKLDELLVEVAMEVLITS